MPFFPFFSFPDCSTHFTIHNTSASLGGDIEFSDPSVIFLDECDIYRTTSSSNFFAFPNSVTDGFVVIDLGCVVLVTQIVLKNSKNAEFSE